MAMQPLTMIPSITVSLGGVGILGASTTQVATGIANAVIPFLISGTVVTVANGIVGAGTGTGKIFLTAPAGIPLLTGALLGGGFNGPQIGNFAAGIIQGLAQDINLTNQVQTVVTGVAAGAGVGTLQGLVPSLLTTLLIGSLTGSGLTGPRVPALASALSNGLTPWFSSGAITTVIAGTPVPPFSPVTGAGLGTIL